jgi:hypothetical protein
MTHLYNLLITLSFIFGFTALAQDITNVSLRAALEQEGTLVSMQEASNPQTIDGFDTTKDYTLEIQNPDGSVVPLRVWLAQDEGQTYAPFISFGYYGPFDNTGGQAFGYLYAFTSVMCLGMDEATRDEIGAFTYGFFPTIIAEWTSDTKQFGDYYVTVGGQMEGENANLLVDIESVGTPGVNGWQITCGLE